MVRLLAEGFCVDNFVSGELTAKEGLSQKAREIKIHTLCNTILMI